MNLSWLFGVAEPVPCCKADGDVGSHRLLKEKKVKPGRNHHPSPAELNIFQFFNLCYIVEMPERTIVGVSAPSRQLPTKCHWLRPLPPR